MLGMDGARPLVPVTIVRFVWLLIGADIGWCTERTEIHATDVDIWSGRCRDKSDGWHECYLPLGHKGLHHNSFDSITWNDGGVVMQNEPGLRRVGDVPRPCLHPEHKLPQHIVYEPGIYEYTCPGCGHTTTFTINRVMVHHG